MRRGAATLWAGLAAAVVLPLASLALTLPLWLAAGISAAVFAGAWLVLEADTGPGTGMTDEALLEARGETARDLLFDAVTAVDRLKNAIRMIRDEPMKAQVADLARIGDKVIQEVRENPERALAVRRLLTFYLPNAASVVDGWRTLESRAVPSEQRMDQTREVVRGLSDAFAKYADDVAEPELQTLDLDLKVLKDALKADLAKTP